eukprot:CAMPEP_0194508662 /NCGR_PEP_ID=MMETSP0253-20130528/39050_1 /TAXON_ID=2966 /ORGANISM="Noctiluca scintillans" /LENGTH=148 /DNA_ID=CAMNT_0039351729 /DNA_START=45 /DNA_END=491 /DNA_ORIENTATION=-
MVGGILKVIVFALSLCGAGAQSRSSTVVDSSCLTASACEGLGGCYEADTQFLNHCLLGKDFVVDSLIPHPVFLQDSCSSLGFTPLTGTPTGTSVPDPCYANWVNFYSNDETLFWNEFQKSGFLEWCPEWASRVPLCVLHGPVAATHYV